eukprot:Hpha_TRINITY_DN15933_c4_g8::TRINITY_DN15933_c4_g8_i1::g.72981::m.72981
MRAALAPLLLLLRLNVAAAAGVAVNTSVTSKLEAYNVDIKGTSVSGLSSGAFFAVQMHVAFSDFIVGAGVFAGGPYDCAKGSLTTAQLTCMNAVTPPSARTYQDITDSRAKAGTVDSTANLAAHNVFLFSGKRDTTVKQTVMDALDKYYKSYITAGTVEYVNDMSAAHTQPTDDPANKNSCTTSSPPYLSNCNYDGAGKALNTIYSGLKPRNDGTLSGKLLEFSQSEFLATGMSMASSGFVYVPASCAAGQRCRLHVSFHGCLQNYGAVGDAYTAHSGYNKWADANDMIVLYPQTSKSTFAPSNPNGCWDWWGYAGKDYDEKSGKQMAAVLKMIQRIASGHPALPAPADVHVAGVTNSSVALAWNAVTGAAGYQVQRDGTVVGTPAAAAFTDTGLQSGTEYAYVVAAVDADKAPGEAASPVNAKTSGPPPPIAPPAELKVTGTTNTTITLTWTAEQGAVSYKVYADGAAAGAPVSTAKYTDTGLQPETTHSYTVSAVDAQGAESKRSTAVTGKTDSSFQCTVYTSSNYAHVQAGRAHDKLGRAYANGSNQEMGLDNTFYKSTLAETQQGYYIVGQCP